MRFYSKTSKNEMYYTNFIKTRISMLHEDIRTLFYNCEEKLHSESTQCIYIRFLLPRPIIVGSSRVRVKHISL